MISYYYGKKGDKGFGTHFTEGDVFPSVTSVCEEIGCPIVFLSFFEFKNKDDYDNAQK